MLSDEDFKSLMLRVGSSTGTWTAFRNMADELIRRSGRTIAREVDSDPLGGSPPDAEAGEFVLYDGAVYVFDGSSFSAL